MKIAVTLNINQVSDRIGAIKDCRTIFGFGLKDAKDFCDQWSHDMGDNGEKRVIFSDAQYGRVMMLRAVGRFSFHAMHPAEYVPVVQPLDMSDK